MIEAVFANGMGILVAFKEKDTSRSGNLSASTFKGALRDVSPPGLSLEDIDMVALIFQDPHTKDIDYERVLMHFYKKVASKTSLKSPSVTSTMKLNLNKNNREQNLSKISTTVKGKGTDE